MNRRLLAVGAAVVLGLAVSAGSAQADPISPDPAHVERTWQAPATAPAPAPVRPPRTWHPTPRQSPATVTRPSWRVASDPLWVTVQAGNTLWGLAVTYRGSGYEWPTIARLNGIQGTLIYAGTTLRVR